MEKIRGVVAFKHNFEDFSNKQPTKIQNKIFKIIEAVDTLKRIPSHYLKHINNTNGLYEIRKQLGSNIWRVFCFFNKGRIVVLLNEFCKKTDKTPRKEINRAITLMNEYKYQEFAK